MVIRPGWVGPGIRRPTPTGRGFRDCMDDAAARPGATRTRCTGRRPAAPMAERSLDRRSPATLDTPEAMRPHADERMPFAVSDWRGQPHPVELACCLLTSMILGRSVKITYDPGPISQDHPSSISPLLARCLRHAVGPSLPSAPSSWSGCALPPTVSESVADPGDGRLWREAQFPGEHRMARVFPWRL